MQKGVCPQQHNRLNQTQLLCSAPLAGQCFFLVQPAMLLTLPSAPSSRESCPLEPRNLKSRSSAGRLSFDNGQSASLEKARVPLFLSASIQTSCFQVVAGVLQGVRKNDETIVLTCCAGAMIPVFCHVLQDLGT